MSAAAASRLSRAPGRWLSVGFANAGRNYNAGNVLALFAAACAAVTQGGPTPLLANLTNAFIGGRAAVLMTAGAVAFFIGGARYDSACRDASSPNKRILQEGDMLSGLGAVLVALGLAGVATTSVGAYAALLGGALHAIGKFGNAFANGGALKLLPLVSRLFSIISPASGLVEARDPAELIVMVLLLASLAIWARADAMLLSDSQAAMVTKVLGLHREASARPA